MASDGRNSLTPLLEDLAAVCSNCHKLTETRQRLFVPFIELVELYQLPKRLPLVRPGLIQLDEQHLLRLCLGHFDRGAFGWMRYPVSEIQEFIHNSRGNYFSRFQRLGVAA